MPPFTQALQIVLVFFLTTSLAFSAGLRERHGDVFYVDDQGRERQVTFTRNNSNAALSPDGQSIVFVHTLVAANPSEEGSELWLVDIAGKSPRRLLANKTDDDPEKNLSQFNSPAFSADGAAIYFLSAAWVTSNTLHRYDLSTGQSRFITDGNEFWLIADGKYAGHLVVQKHKYLQQGGSYDHYWLVTADGREIGFVGKTKHQVRQFMQKQKAANR